MYLFVNPLETMYRCNNHLKMLVDVHFRKIHQAVHMTFVRLLCYIS